jgi:hypothetical protein
MTDQELEQRLRSWYRAQVGDDVHAPVALRMSVAAIPAQRAGRVPWSFHVTQLQLRLATAAVIGVLAVGGSFYLFQRGQSNVGTASPSPSGSAVSSQPAALPTSKPSPMPLTGPLGAGRQIHTATLLADGRVIVAGGLDFADLPLASVVLYDPATGTFSPTGSMGTARAFFTATLLSDGRVLVAGGGPPTWVHPGPDLASAELYDPATGMFSPTGSMGVPREDHTATLLRDGRVLITGGNDSGNRAVASAELYDPKTGTFSPTGSMATARGYHTATLLADGRVLITGGDPCGWGNCDRLASAEVYDPKTGKFSASGSMSTARGFHTATLLADGRVLIAGGDTADVRAEIFDPKTGTFSPTGSTTAPRTHASATLLADGRVLIAGGGDHYDTRDFLASAEIFDPKTGTFSPTGTMLAARSWGQANLLENGRVLVTGGYGDLAPLPSAELFDPVTGTFTPAG